MIRMWSVLAMVLVVVGALLLLWSAQRRLIYFPDPRLPAPAAVGLSRVETVEIALEEEASVRGWFVAGSSGPVRFSVIVFNGNAGNRAYRAPLAAALQRLGCNVLLFDYRGFGDSVGSPTEQGLLADARAARSYLASRGDVRADRLVYFGESLGTAVATKLAIESPPAALILRSPFTSLVDVGAYHYPVLPVRWLLRDRFSAIDAIASVRAPVLIVAGDHDTIVPLDQSRRLFDRAVEPKRLVIVKGADHNDRALLDGDELMASVGAFLAVLPRPEKPS